MHKNWILNQSFEGKYRYRGSHPGLPTHGDISLERVTLGEYRSVLRKPWTEVKLEWISLTLSVEGVFFFFFFFERSNDLRRFFQHQYLSLEKKKKKKKRSMRLLFIVLSTADLPQKLVMEFHRGLCSNQRSDQQLSVETAPSPASGARRHLPFQGQFVIIRVPFLSFFFPFFFPAFGSVKHLQTVVLLMLIKSVFRLHLQCTSSYFHTCYFDPSQHNVTLFNQFKMEIRSNTTSTIPRAAVTCEQ